MMLTNVSYHKYDSLSTINYRYAGKKCIQARRMKARIIRKRLYILWGLKHNWKRWRFQAKNILYTLSAKSKFEVFKKSAKLIAFSVNLCYNSNADSGKTLYDDLSLWHRSNRWRCFALFFVPSNNCNPLDRSSSINGGVYHEK